MVELVAGHGFAAVDVGSLCERAEVGRPHFDRCFADLEDCFLALHEEVMDQLCARVRAASEGRNAWHDRVWAAGTAAMRFLEEDSPRARFLVVAVYNTILVKVEDGSIERGEEFLPELIYLATMPYLGARAAEDELLVEPLR